MVVIIVVKLAVTITTNIVTVRRATGRRVRVVQVALGAQQGPSPLDPALPRAVADDADAAEDDEAGADGAADDFVVLAGDLDAVPEGARRVGGVEDQREELQDADDDGAHDRQRGQDDAVVEEREGVFDPWMGSGRGCGCGCGWLGGGLFDVFESDGLSRHRDIVRDEWLLFFLVVVAAHAHRRHVQAHHQRAVGSVDQTHSGREEDGEDEDEPDTGSPRRLDTADSQQGNLGARVESQAEEDPQWIHFPRAVDELEHALQDAEKHAAALDFPGLFRRLVGLHPNDLSDLHDELVQNVGIHDSEEDQECRRDGSADDATDVAKAVETAGHARRRGCHDNRGDNDDGTMSETEERPHRDGPLTRRYQPPCHQINRRDMIGVQGMSEAQRVRQRRRGKEVGVIGEDNAASRPDN